MKSLSVFLVFYLFLTLSCGSNKTGVVITNVYEGDEGRKVFYDTKEKNGNLLLSDNFSHFNILYRTSDNYWIIVEKTPLFVGEGRVETENILLYLPESREVNVEAYNPSLSYSGIRIEEKDGIECLVTTRKDGNDDLFIPLGDLLKGSSGTIPEATETVSESEPVEEIINPGAVSSDLLTIKLGTNENEIGQGMEEKQLEGGRSIYAVPSFAAFNDQLFIVDAINFRVLIYDYSGKYVRRITYPQTGTDGKTISMRDIAVDKDFIYLVSNYENSVYVIDAATEDVATIISGSGAGNSKFGSIDRIAIDISGNLIIVDTWDNTIYTFSRNNLTFTFKGSEKYTESGQLAANSSGKIYSVTFEEYSFTLKDSEGRLTGTFPDSVKITSVNVVATDQSGKIYVSITNDEPMSQLGYTKYINVISSEGILLSKLPLWSWPGGSMIRHVVVDNEGSVFDGHFTGSELEDTPPTDFIVGKLK